MGNVEACSCEAQGCHPFGRVAAGSDTKQVSFPDPTEEQHANLVSKYPTMGSDAIDYNLASHTGFLEQDPETCATVKDSSWFTEESGFQEGESKGCQAEPEQGACLNSLTESDGACLNSLTESDGACLNSLTESDVAERQESEPEVVPPKALAKFPRTYEFTINLVKTGDNPSIGLDVDAADGIALQVFRFKPGLVMDWNKASPRSAIRIGDRLIQANDVSKSADVLRNEIRIATSLSLTFQRRSMFEILVEKDEATMECGLDVNWVSKSVISIKMDSPVDMHNKSLPVDKHEYAVRQGDRIIKANGEWDSDKVLKVLQTSQTLLLLMQRDD
eukprot:TRINITY_DN9294_c0_g1_i1.p1 TRINITY_DN9294_c0_g1~~TRINITY_DN9294_c0_g1_i1.p1  ORF type:complete len:332 (-),score=62.69 TRINITY_DN9294_c0_g1_i1:141-1136(-)